MPLTTQEASEVLKLVQAAGKARDGVVKLAAIIRSTPDGGDYGGGGRVALMGAINPAINAMYRIQASLEKILYVFENTTNSRLLSHAEQLVRAWTEIDGGIANFTNAAQRASAIPAYAAAGSDFQAVVNLLTSFDRTLPYGGDNPFPTSYPRVIGPHGDYDMTQSQECLAMKYWTDTVSRATVLASKPDFPNTEKANRYLAATYENLSKLGAQWMRVLGIQADVISTEDNALLEFDHQKSSGLRPKSFFQAILSLQLISARTTYTSFSGRVIQSGAAFFLRESLENFSHAMGEYAAINPVAVAAELQAAGGFHRTLSVTWSALDHWNAVLFDFIHTISAPPVVVDPDQGGTIPIGFFDAEEAALDAILAQVGSVRASLLAKEGQTV
jgi:hypothetical protein